MAAPYQFVPLLVMSAFLSSCSNLSYVHDPQTGLISKEQVDPFLKSVRCELKTFYTANNKRQIEYQTAIAKYDDKIKKGNGYQNAKKNEAAAKAFAEAAKIRSDAVRNDSHFLLSPDLFGGVYLDLKVVDAFGFPTAGASSTTFDYKRTLDTTHSRTWLFGPTLNNQNTYEAIDAFLLEQTPGLSAGPDSFNCYAGSSDDLDGLASGKYPDLAKFTRIQVNGTKPLAGWLQERSAQLWNTFRADAENAEQDRMIPVQSTYNFTVQITAGLDVKYSLTAPLWSPAQFDLSASSVQSSLVTIVLNGTDASLAAGVKTGTAVNSTTARPINLTTGAAPYVPVGTLRNLSKDLNLTSDQSKTLEGIKKADTIKNFATKLKLNEEQKKTLQQIAPKPKAQPLAPILPGGSRGYLLYPPALVAPSQ